MRNLGDSEVTTVEILIIQGALRVRVASVYSLLAQMRT